MGRAGFRGFWEMVGLPALRNDEETELSLHWAGALSFHFRWCWGWGTRDDTRQKILEKWPPGGAPC